MAYDAKREPTPRTKSQVNSEDPPALTMTRTRSSHVFKKRTVAPDEAVSPDHPFGWQATQRKSRPKIDRDAIGGEVIPNGSPVHVGRSAENNSRSSSAGSRGDPTMPTSGEPPFLDSETVEMLMVYKCLFGAIDETSIGGAIIPDSPRCASSPSSCSRSPSFGCRGDPTMPNISEFPPLMLDTNTVEKEHQEALRVAVRRVSNGANRDQPVFQDSPLSPPSGRTVQNEINGPFCYATGLEPVQEFLGNLSLSESSMLSSYPSFEEKKKYLSSLSSFEEKPKFLESYSSFGEHCVLGAID